MRTRRRRLKRKIPFIICCVLLLALLAGGYTMAKNIFFPGPGVDLDGDGKPDPPFQDMRMNVLLLGIDARKGETVGRSDTVILASVDTKTKQMALLSIPRDTRVNIPGHGWDKINSANLYGGPEKSMKVVSDLLGQPVNYYVLTNFNGFKDIVDALGGVTIDVERNMYHDDPDDGGAYRINLKKGVQRLDGDKALQYVRYRNYELGDIDRTKYQQKFLMALAKEMLQPSTITKLPRLVPEINSYVKTNLTIDGMISMAQAARKLEDGNILTQTLPGRPVDIDGGSYWGVDPNEARKTMAMLFNGETVTSIVLDTPLSSKHIGSTASSTTDASGSKVSAETTQKKPATDTPYLPGSQPQQGQGSGSKTTVKPGQGSSGSTGGSVNSGTSTNNGVVIYDGRNINSGSVLITPVDQDSKATTDNNTSGGTQSGSGGVNPSIPGVSGSGSTTS